MGGQFDAGQLGRALEQGLGGDTDAGGDGAAEIVPLGRDGVEGGGGAEINDAGRAAIEAIGCDGIDDPVGAHGIGRFVQDAHACLHRSIHDQRVAAQTLAADLNPFAGQWRDHGGQGCPVDIAATKPGMGQEAQELQDELVRHPLVVGGQAPPWTQGLPLV